MISNLVQNKGTGVGDSIGSNQAAILRNARLSGVKTPASQNILTPSNPQLHLSTAQPTTPTQSAYSTLSPNISGGTVKGGVGAILTPSNPTLPQTYAQAAKTGPLAGISIASSLRLPTQTIKGVVNPVVQPKINPPSSLPPPVIPQYQGPAGQTPEEMARTGANGTPTNQNLSGNNNVNTPPPDASTAGTVQGLVGYGQGTDPFFQKGEEINKQIGGLRTELANQTSGINQQGIPLEFKQGMGNVLATREASLENALSGQLGYYTQARGQGESAQASAAGYTRPTTGIPLGTGSMTYDAQGKPVISGGSPFTAGQVEGEKSLGMQYSQNVSAHNQAVAQKNDIVNFLNTTPINPSDFTDVNSVIGLLNGKTSDPKYQQLAARLNEYLQTITPIMGIGGDSTDYKANLAQSLLNGKMSPQAIVDQLNTLDSIQQKKLGQQKLGGGYNANAEASGENDPLGIR